MSIWSKQMVLRPSEPHAFCSEAIDVTLRKGPHACAKAGEGPARKQVLGFGIKN